MSTERLDQHLVRAGLARSRVVAQRMIRDGQVRVGDDAVHKPAHAVQPGEVVTVTTGDEQRWVGRGALKLLHALQVWGVTDAGRLADPDVLGDPRVLGDQALADLRGSHPVLTVAGRRCLDVGASTGGFTQVLLAHGAAAVTALDVGHDQLVPELARDPRVTDLPGTNIRDVHPDQVGTFDLVVGDVSFISLTLVLPAVTPLLEPAADLVLLVKPQFEVGRDRLGRGGIVTRPDARALALTRVTDCATALGLHVRGIEPSPVHGTHGNTEYLLWLATHGTGMMSAAATAARIRDLTGEDR